MVQRLAQLIHQAHRGCGDETQLLREEPDRLSQEYQQLPKPLTLLHSLLLNLLELYLEQLFVLLNVFFVQDGVTWHLDCYLLQFFE